MMPCQRDSMNNNKQKTATKPEITMAEITKIHLDCMIISIIVKSINENIKILCIFFICCIYFISKIELSTMQLIWMCYIWPFVNTCQPLSQKIKWIFAFRQMNKYLFNFNYNWSLTLNQCILKISISAFTKKKLICFWKIFRVIQIICPKFSIII